MKKSFLIFLILVGLWVSEYSSAAPEVLASVKPLALVASDLLGELGEVSVLMPPNTDPHHYSLKISDRRRLESAALIIWVGPALEPFLDKPLTAMDQSRTLALLESDQQTLSIADQHLWLSPMRMQQFTEDLASRLSQLYPEHANAIQQNATLLSREFDSLQQELTQAFNRYRDRGFIADHPAYQALVDDFGLQQYGSFQQHEEVAPTARHLTELSNVVAEKNPSCLLVRNGQQNNVSLQRWSQRWQLPMVTIDILATDPLITSYHEFMASIKEAMQRCFH